MHKLIKDNYLGGFVEGGDERTFYPLLWTALVNDWEIKSVIDVGCGEGHSCKFFKELGCKVLAIDGSKLVKKTAVFEPIIIHDYTKGAYIPDKEYDLIWCCEFVEHIEEKYIENFLATFSKAKFVAMTHALPKQGGYHHVNEREPEYWIDKLQKSGFQLLPMDTIHYRGIADDIYFRQTGLVFYKPLSLKKVKIA